MGKVSEQQLLLGRLELLQHIDGPCSWLPDNPGSFRACGVALALKGEAGQFPAVGSSLRVTVGMDAAAAQVFDYWWKALIPTVRYSSPEATS